MTFEKRTIYRALGIAVALLVFLFLYIDDWSRDFVSHSASFSPVEAESYVAALGPQRPVHEITEAVKMAAGRIRNWGYVGEAGDGNTTSIVFVRVNRVLRFKDDITIRVEDLGGRWRISGESVSRLGIADLGRNPRNLRRFLEELREVGKGAALNPNLGRAQEQS